MKSYLCFNWMQLFQLIAYLLIWGHEEPQHNKIHCNILQLLQFPCSLCFVVKGVTLLQGNSWYMVKLVRAIDNFLILSLFKSKEIFLFTSVNLGPTRIFKNPSDTFPVHLMLFSLIFYKNCISELELNSLCSCICMLPIRLNHEDLRLHVNKNKMLSLTECILKPL